MKIVVGENHYAQNTAVQVFPMQLDKVYVFSTELEITFVTFTHSILSLKRAECLQ